MQLLVIFQSRLADPFCEEKLFIHAMWHSSLMCMTYTIYYISTCHDMQIVIPVPSGQSQDGDLNLRVLHFFLYLQDPTNEQYGGESPLSEPESRLLKHLIDQRKTLGYFNVHSGEWALYTPWDSKPAYAPNLPVMWFSMKGWGCGIWQVGTRHVSLA
jgi:hypothetical protein